MKYLLRYRLFERLDNSTEVTIEQFLEKVGIPNHMRPQIVSWWGQNRSEIRIHLFSFNSPQPIAGVFLGTDTIVINDQIIFSLS
jgi:hypothetical protein